MKMTTNVIPTDRVLTRKDPTFVAVSVDIRLTDVTAQVFVLLVLICSIPGAGMSGKGTLQND